MFKGGLGQNSVSMHFQLANVIFIVLFRCVIYRGSGNINSKAEIWGIEFNSRVLPSYPRALQVLRGQVGGSLHHVVRNDLDQSQCVKRGGIAGGIFYATRQSLAAHTHSL